MVRRCTDTIDKSALHVWFTGSEMPLRSVVPRAVDQCRTLHDGLREELTELYGFDSLFGPELAVLDSKHGYPAQRIPQPVVWQQTCSYTTNTDGKRQHYISCEGSSQIVLIPQEGQTKKVEIGSSFTCVVWNPQSLGQLLVDKTIVTGKCQQQLQQSRFSTKAEGLSEYITKHQPDVITMPEASIPSRIYRTSALYDLAARQFATKHGYQWICAHHVTGQAHHVTMDSR